MNVARSGNFMSALFGAGVRFGVINHIDLSAPGKSMGSMTSPPASSGPAGENVRSSIFVWQPTQLLTYRARYSPRSFVGPVAGATGGGWISLLGLKAGA